MAYPLIKKSLIVITFSVFGISTALAAASDDFVTTWQTKKDDATITIPTKGEGYNYSIDWDNDGVFDEAGLTGDATYTYKKAGKHTIRIKGNFPRIFIANGSEKEKIISVDQWVGHYLYSLISFSHMKQHLGYVISILGIEAVNRCKSVKINI